MNRLNNLLLTVMLSGMIAIGSLNSIDTDRRVVPLLEKAKIFLLDVRAENAASIYDTAAGTVLVYNEGGHGTGFWVSPTKLVTNNHMVARYNILGQMTDTSNQEVTIQLRDGTQAQARVLKTDRDKDLALIEVIGEVRAPKVLKLSQRIPQHGDFVYITGNGGFDFFWSKGGKIGSTYKFNDLWKNTQQLDIMKSKGGFSGSPLIDGRTGEVVGVHCGGFNSPSILLSINIPLVDLKEFIGNDL